jgi:protein gp37
MPQPAPAHICWRLRRDRVRLSRVKHLQQSPAAVRFLSIDPLIAPVGSST